MKLEAQIKEIIMRWFSNPPYLLLAWMTKDFIKGLTGAQTIELLKLFQDTVWEALPKTKVFPLRKDNPQYSLGQTNGYYICLEEIKSNLKAKGIMK